MKAEDTKEEWLMNLMDKLQAAAQREGIDLMGFAPKARFEQVKPEHNPFSIFPEGKTVIMLGKRICRGSLRGVEEGTNFSDYNLFGNTWLEDEFLAMACYAMTSTLEDEGYEAVPIFPNPSEIAPTGVSVRPGKPAPNVFPDFTYAAVAAGICEISYSGLLLSPRFGPRQRFHMIITDAELPATPLLEKSICDGCKKCADSCPLGAISKTESREIEICGKKMTVGVVDYEKCKICRNGAVKNRFTSAGAPDRVAALCNRSCICHLEENAMIGNRFENSFRQNPAWALDEKGISRDTEMANVLGGVFSKDGKRGH
ncbi:MAG: hypothetical protein E7336_02260 [Clostridiales bacterium]|nr:hypothetical protein [Clostridiales bacterium]